MDNNINLIFLKYAHVYIYGNRCRRSKKDIGYFRRDHRPAPAISQCCTGKLLGNIFIMLIHTHMSPVHHFHNFQHCSPWDNTKFTPGLKCLWRDPFHKWNFPFELSVSCFQLLVQVFCNLFSCATFNLYSNGKGNIFKLLNVFYLVIFNIASNNFTEDFEHGHTVIRMCGRSGSYHPCKISCHDCIYGCTAYANLTVWVPGI